MSYRDDGSKYGKICRTVPTMFFYAFKPVFTAKKAWLQGVKGL